jgi:ethylbenzene dioxygenase alpha subunit
MAPAGQLHDETLPGIVHSGQLSDANQRLFYKKWAELMDAEGWADVPLSVSTIGCAEAAQ